MASNDFSILLQGQNMDDKAKIFVEQLKSKLEQSLIDQLYSDVKYILKE